MESITDNKPVILYIYIYNLPLFNHPMAQVTAVWPPADRQEFTHAQHAQNISWGITPPPTPVVARVGGGGARNCGGRRRDFSLPAIAAVDGVSATSLPVSNRQNITRYACPELSGNRTIIHRFFTSQCPHTHTTWVMLLVLLFVGLVAPTTIPPLPACQHLKYTYSSRGVPDYDIPGKPVQGIISFVKLCSFVIYSNLVSFQYRQPVLK